MSRPDRAHPQLMRAILANGERGLAAARAWERSVALDDVDPQSFPLLPMLHASMARSGHRLRDERRLHGVARHSWFRAARVEERLTDLRSRLAAVGIDSVPVGGPSRRRFYDPTSSRTLADAGLLVAPDAAPGALELVLGAGWRPFGADLDRPQNQRLAALAEPGTGEPIEAGAAVIDLHWRVCGPRFTAAADDAAVLARAGSDGLAAPDELLHTLLHGPEDAARRASPWLVDAVRIAQHTDRAGWNEFLATTIDRRLNAVVVDRLEDVAALTADAAIGPVVPAAVTERLRAGITARQRRERACQQHFPPGGYWYRYRRETEAGDRAATVLGFARWLRRTYDLNGPADIVRRVRRSRRRD